MRAIGYVRVSSDKQDNSAEYQEARIRAQALVNPEIELIDVIVDINEFSGNLDRPGVQKILEMVRTKKVDSVIICKLDRLSRSTRDVIELVDLFNKKKVALVSLSESLDTQSPIGQFVVKILASFAEMERQLIGSRTRDGLANIKAKGFPAGEAPFGFAAQPRSDEEKRLKLRKSLLPNPAEQKILDLMSTLRDKGESYGKIAVYLNERKLFNREGNPWVPQRVFGILKNQRKAEQ